MIIRKQLVIFGAWYFADVIESLACDLGWEVLGRVDPNPPREIVSLVEIGGSPDCFVAIGDNSTRRYVSEKLIKNGRNLVSILEPTAVVNKDSSIGSGSYIGEYAVVRAHSHIGRGAQIHAGAIISHHCNVGHYVTLGPNSTLAGRVKVENEVLIGAGSVARPRSRLEKGCTIGSGTVVIDDVEEETVVIGNPAKVLTKGGKFNNQDQSDWSSNTCW